jgi:hypothetical protein
MQRLVTFGCSCTFGEALPDCIITDYNSAKPSKFAWPSVLAGMLRKECVNLSSPGSSNFKILDTILSTPLKKEDVVVVMWSYFGRDMLIDDKGRKFGFHSSDTNELVNAWASVHGLTDLMYRSWLYIHHAQLYLTSLGIDFYFLHVDNDLKFKNLKPEWAQDVKLLDTYIGKYAATAPKAADNRHPGEHAHALTAFSIFYNIKQLNNTK